MSNQDRNPRHWEPQIQLERHANYLQQQMPLLQDYIIAHWKPPKVPIVNDSLEFLRHNHIVYAFMITKVVWYKLRVFSYRWITCRKEPATGIYYLIRRPISKGSVKQEEVFDVILSQKDAQDKIVEKKKQFQQRPPEQELSFYRGELPLEKVGAYKNIREAVSQGLNVRAVQLNQIVCIHEIEIYELRLQVVVFNRHHILRVGGRDKRFRLDLIPVEYFVPLLDSQIVNSTYEELISSKNSIVLNSRLYQETAQLMRIRGWVQECCYFDNSQKKLSVKWSRNYGKNKQQQGIKNIQFLMGFSRSGVLEIEVGGIGLKEKSYEIIDMYTSSGMCDFNKYLKKVMQDSTKEGKQGQETQDSSERVRNILSSGSEWSQENSFQIVPAAREEGSVEVEFSMVSEELEQLEKQGYSRKDYEGRVKQCPEQIIRKEVECERKQ